MTALERVEQYIGIFINVGDRWEGFVPLDGERTPTGIRIDGIEVGPDVDRPGVWWLNDGVNPVRHYQAVTR